MGLVKECHKSKNEVKAIILLQVLLVSYMHHVSFALEMARRMEIFLASH